LISRRIVGRVVGASMEPDFCDGHIIVIDTRVEPNPGDLIVVRYGGPKDFLFGQYYPRDPVVVGETVFNLVPLNQYFPTITIDSSHPAELVGTMVGHSRSQP